MPECKKCGKRLGFLSNKRYSAGEGPFCAECYLSVTSGCKTCGKILGFWSKQYTGCRTGPFCKDCIRRHWAFAFLYGHVGDVESGAKAVAWHALCHLVCAERVNIIRDISHVLGASSKGEPTWPASKASAIKCAREAAASLPADSPGKATMNAILERATAIDAPRGPEVHMKEMSTSAGPIFAHVTMVLDQLAITACETTIDDLVDTLESLPNHEWLGRAPIHRALRLVKSV